MTREVLQVPQGTYELLNRVYKSRLMRIDPDLPWYGQITGFTAEAKEVVRLIKDPVEGGILLHINRHVAGLVCVTHKAIINPDDTVAGLQTLPGMMAIEQSAELPQANIDWMLSVLRMAFHIKLPQRPL